MRCRVADESVVVMKLRPVKASNGVEDKTGVTCMYMQDLLGAKSPNKVRREEVSTKLTGS